MPPRSVLIGAATRERAALTALFAGAIAIAFSPIFVRLSEVGPTASAFYRPALAFPALFVWLAFERPGSRRGAVESARRGPARRPSVRDRSGLVLAGIFFAGDLAFWHWSITFTSVANSTLFANFAPLFVTLGAFALFGERVRPAFLAGLAVALAGTVLLMGQSLSFGPTPLLGDALGLVTAVFYAAYMLTVSRLGAVFTTATIVTWSAGVTALTLLPVAWISGESLAVTTLHGWAMLLGLALVSHAGGQSLIAYALAHLPATFSSVALLVQPGAAALVAWVLLDEPLGPLQAAGGAVILGGILIARRASRA